MNIKRVKAFTLVETILYLGLFNIIFIAVVTFTISVSQNNKAAEYANALEKNSIFVSQHISDSFDTMNNVDEANSNLGHSDGVLRLTKDTDYLEYYLSDGKMYITDGSNTHKLVDTMVNINNFTINKVIDSDGNIVGVHMYINFVPEKFTDQNKTIDTYYAFR